MHLLEAFVLQVEGLSPKQISGPARASLVAFAQEIVALLGDEVPGSSRVLDRTHGDRVFLVGEDGGQ